MGTFHQHKGDLHGITVVVETTGDELFVGRCDEVTPEGVVLHDADVHREGTDSRSRAEYLARAARFGVWKQFDRVLVPTASVAAVRRLAELEG